ncbi:MAG: bifunctional ADP-heptose synthase [Bacteroidota bacterium]|nr:bifunctional ADP-heptose synthase [Bacteroidota bacterium]
MIEKQVVREIFDSFNELKVIVIGDVMVDTYLFGKVDRISPEAPVPIVGVTKRESNLGGASNVAVNLKSLGAEPIICSVIGEDQQGELFIELLKKENISSEGIIKSEDRITTVKNRVIGNNHQMLRVDEEIDTNINSVEEQKLIEKIQSFVDTGKINAIIFEDYDKGVITPNIISKVVEFAESKNIPVVVDPKKRNFSNYKNITLIKPNLKELREGLKIDINTGNIQELSKITKSFHQLHNIGIILLTLSEYGVYISKYNEETGAFTQKHIPAHIRNISDVSGAGDTVISVATVCLALNLDTELIASISNLAGGIVCEKLGAVPINKSRLLSEVLSM